VYMSNTHTHELYDGMHPTSIDDVYRVRGWSLMYHCIDLDKGVGVGVIFDRHHQLNFIWLIRACKPAPRIHSIDE
jgi:hypothetical protein